MRELSVCTLIKDAPRAHGAHETVTETGREVYCEVHSAGRSEFYQAASVGLRPEYVLKLRAREDWEDEIKVEFEGKRYRVIRSYITDDGGVELTIQRGDGRQ